MIRRKVGFIPSEVRKGGRFDEAVEGPGGRNSQVKAASIDKQELRAVGHCRYLGQGRGLEWRPGKDREGQKDTGANENAIRNRICISASRAIDHWSE